MLLKEIVSDEMMLILPFHVYKGTNWIQFVYSLGTTEFEPHHSGHKSHPVLNSWVRWTCCQPNSRCLDVCMFLSPDFTRSLSITTPDQMIEKAKGETAYLPCKFTLSPEDQGPLDIEWLLSPADNQKVDQVVSLLSACSLSRCPWNFLGVHHYVDHTGRGGEEGAM